MRRRPRILRACLFWLGLALLEFFLRAPSFTDAFFDPDVAASVYSAQLLARGSCIYPDAVETKPPGSYAILALLLAIGRDMAGVHLLVAVYHLLVAAVLAAAVSQIADRASGRFAAVLYGAYSAMGFVNGLAPNFETWTLLPLAAAAWAIAGAFRDPADWRPLAAGAFAGLAVLAKQQAVLVAAGLGAATLFMPSPGRPLPRIRAMAAKAGLFAIGLSVPVALVLAWFAAKGCLLDLLSAMNPARNVGYVGTTHAGQIVQRAGAFFFHFTRHGWFLLGTAAAGLVLAVRHGADDPLRRLLVPWLLGALLAVLAGTKFFPHYAFLLLPPAAALGGCALGRLYEKAPRPGVRAVVAVLAVTALAVNLRREAILAGIAARNLVREGRVESRELFRKNETFGPEWNGWSNAILSLEMELHLQAAGKYIRARSAPDETILVYDYIPSIYWYAGRRAPTRHHMNFEVAYELPDDYGRWHAGRTARLEANRREMMRDLAAQPPRFIVRARFERPVVQNSLLNPLNIYGDHMLLPLWRTPLFPELRAFVEAHYRPAAGQPDTPLEILERVDASFATAVPATDPSPSILRAR